MDKNNCTVLKTKSIKTNYHNLCDVYQFWNLLLRAY